MNTPSQADTSAVANQLVRQMTAGTTERELVATVARASALQDPTAAAEKRAERVQEGRLARGPT